MTTITSEDIDGLPFLPALEKAAEIMWCGILRILNGTEQIGAVYMCDGNIAWAVSRNQTENFGSFLERIGMIPKEQHADIVNQYRSLGKSKKLGTLLEEAGLISHSKLRECLMAHIRAAITSLMDVNQIVVSAKYGEMNVDSNLLFLTSEVLPRRGIADDFNKTISPDHSGQINADSTTTGTGDSAILERLAAIPGYEYSFISGTDGKLLAFHKADGLNSNVEEAVSSTISWINTSKTYAEGQHLEKMEFMLIEYEKGSLNVQWFDINPDFFIAACYDKKGKLGVIKHKINELMPASRTIIAENINRQEN